MTIKFLKAGSGDSILIQHAGHNILVDGGNDNRYLIDQLQKIQVKGEGLDMVIVTHHDDDHIAGILDVLELIQRGEFPEKFIKRIVFNSPQTVKRFITLNKEKLLSYRQAAEVEKITANLELSTECFTENSEPVNFGTMRLSFLSPTAKDAEEYAEGSGEYLASDYRCDWNASMRTLAKDLNDDSQDNTVPNKSSIVVLVECEGKRVLLTGDTTPLRFDAILEKLRVDAPDQPVRFDLVKLPHHGSYRSLNKKLIEKIQCTQFVISTNSRKYNLPNKRALLKILTSLKRGSEKVNFIFNYQEPNKILKIKSHEFQEYNFELTQNNELYGFVTR